MLNQPKVMVIDNDENILSVFKGFLNKEHCDLIAASCIEEAIVMLEQQQIDLLIMDINLYKQPNMTLFNLMRELQKNLPIIIISSYTDVIEEKEAIGYGADYFLPKPLELNILRAAVRKCLHIEKHC
jgi:DNA-binding response OmpR family regulator